MKAAILTGPRTFEVREIPDPTPPSDGLVLKVKACGVCGSDLRRWREGPPAGVTDIIPGHEVSGVVVEIGADVKGYALGDRLALAPDIHCGHCWYCARPVQPVRQHPAVGHHARLPRRLCRAHGADRRDVGQRHRPSRAHRPERRVCGDGRTLLVGAGRPCQGADKHRRPRGGDRLRPHRLPARGCSQGRGATTCIIDVSAQRLEMAQRFEPDLALDGNSPDLVQKVRAWTGGLGADVVICANPVASTQTQAVQMTRKGGRVVLFGGLPKANPMTALDGNLIHYGEIEIVGAFSYHPTAHSSALDLFQRGVIPVEKLITHRFTLDEVGAAFVAADSGAALKAVVIP